ncbi:phage tail tape measure C-terminal domain-containing protein [Haematobacter genomosp. 1]|nr:phage tail tape measure C-terminal domain-containing protein [Haematobacter genomosp. 1]
MSAYGGRLDSASASALRLFETQQQLYEVLQRLTEDPVKDYFKGIPTEGESFKNLQAEALTSVRDGLKDVFMTGDIDVSNIVETIRSSLATMMADQVMTMLGDALGYQTGATILAQGIVAGAAQGGAIIASAMTTGSVAGAGAGAASAGATAAASGGFWNSVGSMIGLFKEGGYSDQKAVSYAPAPAALFKNAPQFKNGTANTFGIPAILHDDEAVVPLTRGRKIPVDASRLETGGGGSSVSNSFGGIVVNLQTSNSIEDPIQAQRAANQLAELI